MEAMSCITSVAHSIKLAAETGTVLSQATNCLQKNNLTFDWFNAYHFCLQHKLLKKSDKVPLCLKSC